MTDIGKKQYLLSSVKQDLLELQEYTAGGFYLYVHPLLQLQAAENKAGEKIWLLGHAYCMDDAGKTPMEDIRSWDGEDTAALTRFWTGRWVLITETSLVTDACGLLAAFYWQGQGQWCVSSSPALISQLLRQPVAASVSETGLSWQLLPQTRIKDIKLPLCSQRLILGQTLQVAQHLWMTDETGLSGEEKCSRLAEFLVNGISNISAHSGKKLQIALTGGKDSRLVLAAALKAGVPFEAYTAQHDSISSSDIKIPRELAKKYGFPHRYVKKLPVRQELLEDYDAFTAGNSKGADRQFYACGQFASFGDDALILRGGLFEAGQTYARSYTGPETDALEKGMKRYYAALSEGNLQQTAFEKWLENAKENPVPHVDIRDRFYVEQRVGGWVAAIEQSLDICEFTSIQIANCPALLSVLLSADDQERKALTLAYGTIRVLEPGLMAYDINKTAISDKLRYVCGILKSPVKKLRAYLSKRNRR